MSIVGMSPEERLWETKLQYVSEKLDSLSKKVDDKIGSLIEAVKAGNANFVKILDDHESRLRKQADVDSSQAAEISLLRERIASFGSELTAVKILIERIEERQKERIASENSELKKIALKLLEYIIVGGASGGAVYAAKLMRLF